MNIELGSLKEFEDYYRSLPPKEYIDEEIIINGLLRIDKFKQISVLTNEDSYGKTWSFIPMPESNYICSHCGKGWSLDNVVYETYMGNHYHNACLRSIIDREQLSNFLHSFRKAGITPLKITHTENKYWPESYKDKHFYNNWYLLETNLGTFEIGWRKRVISVKLLNPSNFHIDFSKLVDSNTTSSKNSFHAWGYNKLDEYLSKITEQLEKTNSDAPDKTEGVKKLLEQIKRKVEYLSECDPELISVDELVRISKALDSGESIHDR